MMNEVKHLWWLSQIFHYAQDDGLLAVKDLMSDREPLDWSRPLNSRKSNIWTFLSTCCPLGYTPFIPGTAGAAAGVVLGFFIRFSVVSMFPDVNMFVVHLLIALLLLLFSWFSYHCIFMTEKLWGVHDDRRIVIDEVAGQALVTAFLPPSAVYLLLSFVMFRLFDIWKPWFIGSIDRNWNTPLGTLMDDLAAGLLSLIIMVCCIYISKYFDIELHNFQDMLAF
ncbi:MAG: phosphatidylglycerophosphatase A [Oligoflexales bacterium]|nr:phosphatidylglycerophosphatase A [Oligoflexales bacterium]